MVDGAWMIAEHYLGISSRQAAAAAAAVGHGRSVGWPILISSPDPESRVYRQIEQWTHCRKPALESLFELCRQIDQ